MSARRAATRAWRTYAGESLATRAFLAARIAIVPIGELEPELCALDGRVLSLGSGHGLLERFAAELNPGIEIEGYELDGERVRAAARTAARAPRVHLHEADVTELPESGEYDAALAVDVMHHIPPAAKPAVIDALARAVRPGGTCLVKDIADSPRWQHSWNRLHDRLVAGEEVHCLSPEAMAAEFVSRGFETEEARRLGRHSPYPHYLLRLRRRS